MLTSFLNPEQPDPLLAVARKAADDARPGKLDLTVGVYRDDNGRTPVMHAVKQAEARLLEGQATKAYLGVDGNAGFIAAIFALLGLSGEAGDGWAGVQTPGGTGALRLAAELLARGGSGRTVWLPQPCWTNHQHVLRAGGLGVQAFPAYDPIANRADLAAMLAAVEAAHPGDVFLLQPICNNPTGADLSLGELEQLAEAIAQRGLIPLLDVAYHGFAGGIDEELAYLDVFTARLPELVIAYSCSKNFSLYRERVGALLVKSCDRASRDIAHGVVMALARGNYSMPPDHGAAVVAEILGDAALRATWGAELTQMTQRLNTVREALAALGHVGGADLSVLRGSRGMFCQVPLPVPVIRTLREDHAVYMAETGRINLAALPLPRVAAFADALEAASRKVPA
ncbi:MAG: aromatic amino acid transaminase [Novosphingobium sp.]|nr:aromatic amino acid transaminase [Novosphingobium sp.]